MSYMHSIHYFTHTYAYAHVDRCGLWLRDWAMDVWRMTSRCRCVFFIHAADKEGGEEERNNRFMASNSIFETLSTYQSAFIRGEWISWWIWDCLKHFFVAMCVISASIWAYILCKLHLGGSVRLEVQVSVFRLSWSSTLQVSRPPLWACSLPAHREDDRREESEECSRHSFLLHQPAAAWVTIHVCFIFPPLAVFVLHDRR